MDVGNRPPHYGIPKLPEGKEPAPIPPQLPSPSPQLPAVADNVLYRLTGMQATGAFAPSLAAAEVLSSRHEEGDAVPAIITRVNGDGTVNLHLLLDGPATHWVSGIQAGAEPGMWDRA